MVLTIKVKINEEILVYLVENIGRQCPWLRQKQHGPPLYDTPCPLYDSLYPALQTLSIYLVVLVLVVRWPV